MTERHSVTLITTWAAYVEVGDDNDEDEDGVVGVSDDDIDVENAEDSDNSFLSSPSYFLKQGKAYILFIYDM